MDVGEESIAGERALLDAAVRADASVIDELLHPDFAERGQSGRWWTREETLRTLPNEATSFVSPQVQDLKAAEVADGVVLITYVSGRPPSLTGRSSLWIKHDGRMRMRWHQGTPLPPTG